MSTRKKANTNQNTVAVAEDGDEIHFVVGAKTRVPDDVAASPEQDQFATLLEAITRIGGEVCRMRSEVDGLLDQNAQLVDAFDKLRAVIEEKGQYSLDDFELACEVLETPGSQLKTDAIKKMPH